MIIEREVGRWCVRVDEPIAEVLRKLDANHQGFVLGVDEAGVLKGVLTDGDVRRWLMKQTVVDLGQPAGLIVNKACAVALEAVDEQAKEEGADACCP